MAVRFRKSKKLLPGIRLNLSKKSASITVGPKWLHKTFSTTGKTTTSVSIPGTGIYYSASDKAKKKEKVMEQEIDQEQVLDLEQPIHEPVTSGKSRIISLLLCIFTFCGHRFYTGKTGSAILYLFTAGLFGFGWVCDIIKVSSGKFTDANGDYVRDWKVKNSMLFIIIFAAIFIFGLVAANAGKT